MRSTSDPPSTVTSSSSNHTEQTIRQPWLTILRTAWVVTALAALLVLGLSVPGYLQTTRQSVVPDGLIDAPVSVVSAITLAAVLVSFLTALLCLALAGLLFWRRSTHGMSLFVSFVLLGYGIIEAGPAEILGTLLPVVDELRVVLLSPLLGVLFTLLACLFPNGQFVPRWSRWIAVLGCILGGLAVADYLKALPSWLGALNDSYIGYVIVMVLIVRAQVYRYRRVSSPAERQQTKWVVLGIGLWFLLMILVFIPYSVAFSWSPDTPLPLWTLFLSFIWTASLAIIPLCLTIAVLRFRLYDIDVLIRKTLIYSLLTGILALIYFGGIVLTQQAFRAATGETPDIAIVLTTLLIAALFTPLRRRIQATIDRRLYRRKYDVEQTLEKFNRTLRDEVNLEDLKASLVDVVNDTMQPAKVALWVRE